MKHKVALTFFIFCLSILPFIFLTNRLYLIDPPVVQDEAVLFDIASNIAQTGTLETSIYGNAFRRLSTKAFWHPPLYYFTLAGWIKLFGSSIEAARSLSVLAGLLTLVVVFIGTISLYKSSQLAGIALFLVSIDPMFGKITRVARMDSLSLLWTTASIYVLLSFNRKITSKKTLILGILSAFALLTHPLSLIAPAIIVTEFIILAFQRNLSQKTFMLFLAPLGVAIAVWVLLVGDNTSILFGQFTIQIAYKAQAASTLRQFLTDPIIRWYAATVLGIVFTLIFLFKKTHSHTILHVLFIMAMIIGAVEVGKVSWYLAYLAPAVGLLATTLLFITMQLRKPAITILSVFLTSVLVILNVYMNLQLLPKSLLANTWYHEFTQTVSLNLPKGSHVLIASVPDPYIDFATQRHDLTLTEYPPFLGPGGSYEQLFADAVKYPVFQEHFLSIFV